MIRVPTKGAACVAQFTIWGSRSYSNAPFRRIKRLYHRVDGLLHLSARGSSTLFLLSFLRKVNVARNQRWAGSPASAVTESHRLSHGHCSPGSGPGQAQHTTAMRRRRLLSSCQTSTPIPTPCSKMQLSGASDSLQTTPRRDSSTQRVSDKSRHIHEQKSRNAEPKISQQSKATTSPGPSPPSSKTSSKTGR